METYGGYVLGLVGVSQEVDDDAWVCPSPACGGGNCTWGGALTKTMPIDLSS